MATDPLAIETAARKAADDALDTRLKAVEAKVGITPPVVEPPITQPPIVTPPAATGAYGTGLSGDSRNNHQIGWTARARLSFRFRATTTGKAVSLRVQERGGTIYSGGNGGTIKASIQADANGLPSGTTLGSLSWSPGNPAGNWEVWTLHSFPTPVALQAGTLYHLVFDNTATDQTANWISFNVLFHYGSTPTPRQAAFTDDFAVLYNRTGSWQLQASDVPIFDLALDNGAHEGQAYIGTLADSYGNIAGTTNMVRERFTVSGADRQVSRAHVRTRRIAGAGALALRLEKADGTVVAQASVPSTSIPTGVVPGPGAALQGDTWAHATFPSPVTLTAGQSYALRLSTDAASRYTVVPIQDGTVKGLLSRRFTDGDPQRTTDGGANWAPLNPYWATDLQFYLD